MWKRVPFSRFRLLIRRILARGERVRGQYVAENGDLQDEVTRLRRRLHKSESARAGLAEELREQIKARDEFLAAVAHELRNPMTPITLQLSAVLRILRKADANCRESALQRLERLERSVDHYLQRVAVLLDLSQISSGHRSLEITEVDFSALVREIVQARQDQAANARSTLTAEVMDGVVGAWDRIALEQVVENLLSNAIKYGDGKPILVTLTADAERARLEVLDQGIGIAAEDQERIFGHFERAVKRRTHGGFGVGLWIASRLVGAMGGDIAVISRPGAGSTFTVTLPLRAEPS